MSCLNKSLLGLVAISAIEASTAPAKHILPKISTAYSSTMTNTTQEKSMRTQQAAEIFKKTDIVCFDVDSTVIKEEGIDELAKFCGKGQEVARLTREAMGGTMTFQDALKLRLDIINPSQKEIREFVHNHPSTISPGIRELVAQLKRDNKEIYLVSGGFDCLIEPIAVELGIPLANLFANKLMFYCDGQYAGFDATQPTSRSGGKAEAIKHIKKRYANDAVITMVGDGATDLEAAPPADYFIGYGGNVIREEVRNRAQYYVTDFTQVLS